MPGKNMAGLYMIVPHGAMHSVAAARKYRGAVKILLRKKAGTFQILTETAWSGGYGGIALDSGNKSRNDIWCFGRDLPLSDVTPGFIPGGQSDATPSAGLP